MTENGQRELTATPLEELEDQIYGLMDQLAGELLESLLQQQAQQLEAAINDCPCCGTRLQRKGPQTRRWA